MKWMKDIIAEVTSRLFGKPDTTEISQTVTSTEAVATDETNKVKLTFVGEIKKPTKTKVVYKCKTFSYRALKRHNGKMARVVFENSRHTHYCTGELAVTPNWFDIKNVWETDDPQLCYSRDKYLNTGEESTFGIRYDSVQSVSILEYDNDPSDVYTDFLPKGMVNDESYNKEG